MSCSLEQVTLRASVKIPRASNSHRMAEEGTPAHLQPREAAAVHSHGRGDFNDLLGVVVAGDMFGGITVTSDLMTYFASCSFIRCVCCAVISSKAAC